MVQGLESKGLVDGEGPNRIPWPVGFDNGFTDGCGSSIPAGGVSLFPALYCSGLRRLSPLRGLISIPWGA